MQDFNNRRLSENRSVFKRAEFKELFKIKFLCHSNGINKIYLLGVLGYFVFQQKYVTAPKEKHDLNIFKFIKIFESNLIYFFFWCLNTANGAVTASTVLHTSWALLCPSPAPHTSSSASLAFPPVVFTERVTAQPQLVMSNGRSVL